MNPEKETKIIQANYTDLDTRYDCDVIWACKNRVDCYVSYFHLITKEYKFFSDEPTK